MCVARMAMRRHAGSCGDILFSTDSYTSQRWLTVEAKRTGDPDQVQAVYLEKLADELSHRGLEAWLMAPPGRRPSLYVVNPAARALEENVYAGCGKDGIWWFWWSWAERIAVADDVDLAATTIVRVLASLLRND